MIDPSNTVKKTES